MRDEEIEKRLKASVRKMDETGVKTPELLYFTELVKREKRVIEKRQNIQFAVFILLSVFIAAAVMLCYFASVAAFVTLQAAAFVLFLTMIIRAVRARGAG